MTTISESTATQILVVLDGLENDIDSLSGKLKAISEIFANQNKPTIEVETVSPSGKFISPKKCFFEEDENPLETSDDIVDPEECYEYETKEDGESKDPSHESEFMFV